MISFRFLEDVALADAAFEAAGTTPSELFTAAAQAVIETIVNPHTVAPIERKSVARSSEHLDTLLFDWLEEIVYAKDADRLVFHDATCAVSEDSQAKQWHLQAELTGERIAPERHELRADVKAVTKHRFSVRHDKEQWVATVVLDI